MDLSAIIAYLSQKDISLKITPKTGFNAVKIELSHNNRHSAKLIPKDELNESIITETIHDLIKALFPKFRAFNQKLRTK